MSILKKKLRIYFDLVLFRQQGQLLLFVFNSFDPIFSLKMIPCNNQQEIDVFTR